MSDTRTESVNADPGSVRLVLAKLAKAGSGQDEIGRSRKCEYLMLVRSQATN